ncbi:hypothetical protein AVEN_65416-1, partial [Araneus ventricosus]
AVSFGDTPRIQHAPEGDTGVVLCNVKADPKPVVNWYFEGTKISNDKKYQIHPDNHSLKIHDLTRDDAGEYKCKAFVFTHLSSQIKDFDIKLHVQCTTITNMKWSSLLLQLLVLYEEDYPLVFGISSARIAGQPCKKRTGKLCLLCGAL